MKTKYLFSAAIAALAIMATACQSKEEMGSDNSNLEVSTSYVSIDNTGGTNSFTIKASESWTITPTIEYDSKGNVTNDPSTWLEFSTLSGGVGETTVTITAPDTTFATKTAELQIAAGEDIEYVYVTQLVPDDGSLSTCADVIDGPSGKYYTVRGTCTAIANTEYGNYYLEDETGQIYVYGTVDDNGDYPKSGKSWEEYGIEVGDIVTVNGPKTVYNGTVELVDVKVIKVEKSYLKMEPLSLTFPCEGGSQLVDAIVKGTTFTFESSVDWLSVGSVVEEGDTTAVTIIAAANPEANARTGEITFYSSGSGQTISVKQLGSIIETTVSTIASAEDDNTVYYRVTACVSSAYNFAKGRFYIKDATGELYCYNITDKEGGSTDLSNILKVGDIVTLVGYKTSYKGTNELVGYIESYISVKEVSIAEFNAAEDSNDVWYKLTGVVTDDSGNTEFKKKFDLTNYGNFDIVDDSGSVYVYGVVPAYGGASKQFGTLGVAEGDTLTIIGTKTTYKGLVEVNKAFYLSHTAKE